MMNAVPSRRAGRLPRRLLAVLLGALFTLFLLEAALRLAYPSLPPVLRHELYTTRLTPFSEQRLGGRLLYLEGDKEYGTIYLPGEIQAGEASNFQTPWHVTAYAWWDERIGFRSPPPQDGALEAVAIGDSFTFCWDHDGECWVDYLGTRIGLDIANLGQPGTGGVSQLRRYRNFVAAPALNLQQPRLVLWQFYGNDYNDDFKLAVLNGTNSAAPNPSIPGEVPMTPFERWLHENSALYVVAWKGVNGEAHRDLYGYPHRIQTDALDFVFGHRYIFEIMDMTTPRNLEGEALYREAILEARQIVEENGGKFVLILIPTKEEAYRPLTEPLLGTAALDALAAARLRLLDFCAAKGLTCFDLLPALQAHPKQVYLGDDPHLNREGNHVVADALAAFLREQGIVN